MKEPPTGSDDFRKLNPHLFPPSPTDSHLYGGPSVKTLFAKGELPAKPRIRQSSKPLLNKLETEFRNELRMLGWKTVLCQAVKLRLANGVWYTPDFITFGIPNTSQPQMVAWEIKGKHIWEDSIVKLKVAAAQYPMFEWRLAHKGTGAWGYQIVTA
jgi:hypothetical protein